jgi:hypothetical protein
LAPRQPHASERSAVAQGLLPGWLLASPSPAPACLRQSTQSRGSAAFRVAGRGQPLALPRLCGGSCRRHRPPPLSDVRLATSHLACLQAVSSQSQAAAGQGTQDAHRRRDRGQPVPGRRLCAHVCPSCPALSHACQVCRCASCSVVLGASCGRREQLSAHPYSALLAVPAADSPLSGMPALEGLSG